MAISSLSRLQLPSTVDPSRVALEPFLAKSPQSASAGQSPWWMRDPATATLDPKSAAACPPLRAPQPEKRTPVRTAVEPNRAATAPPLAAAEEHEEKEAALG